MGYYDNLGDRQKRIESLFKQAVERPLVVVTAGEGYGKSNAVHSYLASSRDRMIWLPLTTLSNYTMHFWDMLVHILEKWDRETAAHMKSTGFPTSYMAKLRFFILVAELASRKSEKVIVVFDDFHCLKDGIVKDFIRDFILADTPNLTSIIISRSQVSFGAAHIIEQSILSDQHLRFQKSEIHEYLQSLGVAELTPSILARIHTLTEGWAFAISILGKYLEKSSAVTDEDIDYAVSNIFRIMENEHFLTLSALAQDAFVLLSLFETFSMDLAVAITDVSLREFQPILTQHPFVRFHMETATYYFHSLFREMLRRKLADFEEEYLHGLLYKAGAWYRNHNQPYAAISCYFKCKSYEELYYYLKEIGGQVVHPDIADEVLQILSEVPDSFSNSHLGFLLYRASMHIHRGDIDTAENLLQTIENKLTDKLHLTDDERSVLGNTYLTHAFLCEIKGDRAFVDCYRRARRLLPTGSEYIRADRMYMMNNHAMIYPGSPGADLQDMLDCLFAAAEDKTALLGKLGFGREQTAAAETHYFRGQLKKAEIAALEAISQSTSRDQWDIASKAVDVLLRCSFAKGNLDEVMGHLSLMEHYAGHIRKYTDGLVLADLAKTYFYIKIDQLDEIDQTVLDSFDQISVLPYLYSSMEFYIKTIYLYHRRRFVQALAFADISLKYCQISGQWVLSLCLDILKALMYYRLDEYPLALQYLELAYQAAVNNNLVMLFVEQEKDMANLLKYALGNDSHGIPHQWLRSILSRTNTYIKRIYQLKRQYIERFGDKSSPTESLTAREKEILRFVCDGMTNEQISTVLGIKITSVKSALTRIYTKLGADNRADAVGIALGDSRFVTYKH